MAGDIVVDGGNSYYRDDIDRAKRLKPHGIHYVDCGTSGGVYGLERGYCLMIGGEPDIVRHLDPRDQEYFRQSRAQRFGMTIEQLCANRDARVGAFRQTLEPLRTTLKSQAFLGGAAPLYPDYIVFGGFQWARTISDFALLETDDPIAAWRERMLDLFGGLARKNPGY